MVSTPLAAWLAPAPSAAAFHVTRVLPATAVLPSASTVGAARVSMLDGVRQVAAGVPPASGPDPVYSSVEPVFVGASLVESGR